MPDQGGKGVGRGPRIAAGCVGNILIFQWSDDSNRMGQTLTLA